MIEVNEVYKKYVGNNYYSVNGIEFQAESGSILGLLGHNGAGKSTTMKMLATLYFPDKGSILINGMSTRASKYKIRKILGVVYEEPRLYDQLTGEENILFHTSLWGLNKKNVLSRLKDLYKELEVDFEKQYVKNYSKGMKQKFSLIRALITDPQLLLLDEPTTGLDIVSRNQIRNYIKRLKASGITIIMTSHIAEDIEALCDRIVILSKGTIIENSTVNNLKSKYSSESFEEAYVKVQKKIGDYGGITE